MHKVKQAAYTYILVYLYISVYIRIYTSIHTSTKNPLKLCRKYTEKKVESPPQKKRKENKENKMKTEEGNAPTRPGLLQPLLLHASQRRRTQGDEESPTATKAHTENCRCKGQRVGRGQGVGAAAAGAGRGLFLLICNALWTLFLALVLASNSG